MLCIGCDYSLANLPERRCPECGRAFDPSDPATFIRGRPLGQFGRWALGPPGWISFTLVGVPSFALLWASTWPGYHYMAGVRPVLFWMAAGFGWFVWIAFRDYLPFRSRLPVPWVRGSFSTRPGRWLLALLLLPPLLGESTLPLRLCFETSRAEFDRLVRSLPPAPAPIGLSGIIPVGRWEVNGTVSRRFTRGEVVLYLWPPSDSVDAFIYDPARDPNSAWSLGGGWFWHGED
jgi:hypothetical protein